MNNDVAKINSKYLSEKKKRKTLEKQYDILVNILEKRDNEITNLRKALNDYITWMEKVHKEVVEKDREIRKEEIKKEFVNSFISLLKTIEDRQKEYDELNKQIIKMGNGSMFFLIDSYVHSELSKTFNSLLGDSIFDYYLFECKRMKNGGLVINSEQKKYPIKTVEDVRNYLLEEVLK